MESKFSPGFYNQEKEHDIKDLHIEGHFPEWLQGALLRTGPALFDLKKQHLRHWFDGMAMLYSFSFRDGKVDFKSKFLKSRAYKKAKKTGSLQIKEWATDPCKSIFEKVKSYFVAPSLTDNGNINIIKYGESLLATSETPLPIVFDPENLATKKHAKFNDELEGQIEPAHPHYDEEGHIYNYLLKYSVRSEYQIFRLNPNTMERHRIATIDTFTPAYMHSIGMTENYYLLAEFPFIVNPVEMKFEDKPLIANYKWKPEEGTKIHVVNRKNGENRMFITEPFFAFHHINAFEEKEFIHMDVVRFDDPGVVHTLYLEKLRSNDPSYSAGLVHRYTINQDNGEVTKKKISDKLLELPKIYHQKYDTKPYRYVYGAGNTMEGNWLDDVTKIDVTTGEHKVWHQKHCYPSEPVFVPSPEAKAEDDGIVLAVIFDSDAKNTFLLSLDAQTFEETGRALVPEILPMSFHGDFFGKV